jgi:hypothetical protein
MKCGYTMPCDDPMDDGGGGGPINITLEDFHLDELDGLGDDDGNDCTVDGLPAAIIQMACTDTIVLGNGTGLIRSPDGVQVVNIVVPMMSPGGSGGGGDGKKRREWVLDEEQADAIRADRSGRRYLRHKDTGLWWTKDTAGHGGSAFKVYQQEGQFLVHFKDADKYGRYIESKHKGPKGRIIRLDDLHGVK